MADIDQRTRMGRSIEAYNRDADLHPQPAAAIRRGQANWSAIAFAVNGRLPAEAWTPKPGHSIDRGWTAAKHQFCGIGKDRKRRRRMAAKCSEDDRANLHVIARSGIEPRSLGIVERSARPVNRHRPIGIGTDSRSPIRARPPRTSASAMERSSGVPSRTM